MHGRRSVALAANYREELGVTLGKFLSEQRCSEKLNNILTLSVTSFMFTALSLASAHCINLQLQKPNSHIKLKDLF
jgi:hypothetical protein